MRQTPLYQTHVYAEKKLCNAAGYGLDPDYQHLNLHMPRDVHRQRRFLADCVFVLDGAATLSMVLFIELYNLIQIFSPVNQASNRFPNCEFVHDRL